MSTTTTSLVVLAFVSEERWLVFFYAGSFPNSILVMLQKTSCGWGSEWW